VLLKRKNKIAGLIMAAGESRRLDSPKQLLKWGNDSLVNHVIQIANQSGINQSYVILGCHSALIKRHIHQQDANILINPDWKDGMSTSIKTGVSEIAKQFDAAFILLVDQPFISSELLKLMMDRYFTSKAVITAPRVGQQQCNPVLFSRQLFPDLLKLNDDKGAKCLLSKNPVEWIDWPDERLLLDIDTIEDYQKALESRNS
jgi:molybdenum cofactor cytidylyltransferase